MNYRTSDEARAHRAALRDIRDRWLYSGEISLDEKRKLISRENEFYYGVPKVSAATGRTLTDDSGDYTHVPVEQQLDLLPRPGDDDEDERTPWWQL